MPGSTLRGVVAERADRGRDSSWGRCSGVRRRRRALRSWATEGEAVARRREVHRSTYAAAPTCLSAPPCASRDPFGGQIELCRLRPDYRSFGTESTLFGQAPADHGHGLRNEGADGSNPFTSTTSPATTALRSSRPRLTGARGLRAGQDRAEPRCPAHERPCSRAQPIPPRVCRSPSPARIRRA